MFSAWHEFRRGKKKKLEIQQFEFTLEENLFQLREELAAHTYQPMPYVSFYVRDPKLRHIHKAHIRDRVLHQAVFRALYLIFDRHFIYDSYASRFGKGVHAAVERLRVFSRKVSENYRRPIFALQCDVRKFFDSVDHELLLGFIRERISDSDALWLTECVIRSFEKTPGRGLPLGNVTSQLFANIYLNKLDRFMKNDMRATYYIRYCDDFVILADNADMFADMIARIKQFLSQQLYLDLHPSKVIIRKFSKGVDFLGYVERPYYRLLRTRTKQRLLRLVTKKNKSSYLGLLKHCKGYAIRRRVLRQLDTE